MVWWGDTHHTNKNGIMSLEGFISRFKISTDELIQIIQDALNEEKEYILVLQKQQLAKGQKADGTSTPRYSPKTIKVRDAEGNPVKGERIAFYDTGDFWNKMWSLAENGELEIYSADGKTEMLLATYGENILGLTDENIEQLLERVVPIIQKKMIQHTLR